MTDALGDDIIWSTTAYRGRIVAKVTRTGSHKAQFRVTVPEVGDVLLDEEVALTYGAIFGPDVDNVRDWQIRAMDVINEWIARQKR